MAVITCARCKASKEPLSQPPVGGKLGETVLASTCPDCWQEWQEASHRIINHYGLNLGDPEHRQQLRELMKEFLNLTPT